MNRAKLKTGPELRAGDRRCGLHNNIDNCQSSAAPALAQFAKGAMTADALLSRLDGVRRTGPDRWIARCPAHDDRKASLAIRELDDARVLVHDFAGCSVEEVLGAVGLSFDDLFPPRPPRAEGYRSERKPWLPSDVFDVARFEVAVASLIACDLHKGRTVSDLDYGRLWTAWSRLEHIAEVAYGL